MKYLQDYIQDEQSALFKELGVFFAFSREQFDTGAAANQDKKPEGTRWCDMGIGMFMPSVNVEEFKRRHTQIVSNGIARDLKENGRHSVIVRELRNYECFYTGEIDDALGALKDYGISAEEVRKVFRAPRKVAA